MAIFRRDGLKVVRVLNAIDALCFRIELTTNDGMRKIERRS